MTFSDESDEPDEPELAESDTDELLAEAEDAGSPAGIGAGQVQRIAQPELAAVMTLDRPHIEDYCRVAAEYVRQASILPTKVPPKKPGTKERPKSQFKETQLALSRLLATVLLCDLREILGRPMEGAFAGERTVGGGLREVQADVSELTATDGLTLAVEIKPVHLAIGRAIWNRFGDVRTFAVNIHLKFPFAVVGGVLTIPSQERRHSGDDTEWKGTIHLVERAVARFVRAGGRRTEGDAPHLLEGIGVVVFDHQTGELLQDVPPPNSGLRWNEFVAAVAEAYDARFGAI